MSLTLGEAKSKALILLDEYSVNGQLIPTTKNADYTGKMNQLADTAQKELSQFRRIKANFEINQYAIDNLVSSLPGADSVKHYDTDIEFLADGARSFYFEVGPGATIFIEEDLGTTWNTIRVINRDSTPGFISFYGSVDKINPASRLKLRFSGNYLYDIRNIALYGYSFANDSDVPQFSTMNKYKMPNDFIEVDKIILENNQGQYQDLMKYYWENKDTLVVDYRYQGKISVQYFKEPTTITNATPDSYPFELDYDIANLIPYYLASIVKVGEDVNMSAQYRRIYETGLMNLTPKAQEGISIIEDVYNW